MGFTPQEKKDSENISSSTHKPAVIRPSQKAGLPLFAQNTKPAAAGKTAQQPSTKNAALPPYDPFSSFTAFDRAYLHQKANLTTGLEKYSSGELGQTRQKTPIKLHYFQGVTSVRALVIAGVHGTERQGLEIAEKLIEILKKNQPFFTVLLVPALFPDNVGRGGTDFGDREEKISGDTVLTNRNFVDVDAPVAGYKDFKGIKQPIDIHGKRIRAAPALYDVKIGKERKKVSKIKNVLHENAILMELIDRFQPHRIISIHGTHNPTSAGVFADPHFISPGLKKQIQDNADLMHKFGMVPGKTQAEARKLFLETAEKRDLARTENDANLAIAAAYAISQKTKNLSTLEKRFTNPDYQQQFKKMMKDEPKRFSDPKDKKRFTAVIGNALDMGAGKETAIWREDLEPGKGFTPKPFSKRKGKGISLGLYGPAKGISVFTVEAAINRNVQDYKDADASKAIEDKDAGVSVADRKAEIMSYAQIIAEVLLGPDEGKKALQKHRPPKSPSKRSP